MNQGVHAYIIPLMKRPIISWDGEHLPSGLLDVPPGVYSLEAADVPEALTGEQEMGISAALAQIDAGEGRTLKDVIDAIRSRPTRG